MKLRKTLTIDDKSVGLISEDVELSLFSPGRATLMVKSPEPCKGIVRLALGYSTQDKDQLYFMGYVETSTTVDGKQQKLMCRELTGLLYKPMPCSLRHPTLPEVVHWFADRTGLAFVVPDAIYAKWRVPCFQTLGNGFLAMESLGAVFGIKKYIWQQQGDGSVFVGSWDDSRWATRPTNLPEEWNSKVTADGRKVHPALPALRPGALLGGSIVTSIQLEGHEMVTKCGTL